MQRSDVRMRGRESIMTVRGTMMLMFRTKVKGNVEYRLNTVLESHHEKMSSI
jgi:hypothetical protein